ncbi:sigma-70 family RNA polymerase sigma factor [Ruegeria sp. HKCCD8929]|uniref:sigma-70 family RNA polymerase sigma factor n=1 Tax=Ruegeria sp. HKCCD8929 TaxID=2683006 RepID=UPI0014888E20|nr:sigma-70 family RNA polymerase sigma factor [Ruegeria sp. HKCCD8929]
MHTTIEELLSRTAARDPEAFRALYDRTVSRQLVIARRILPRNDLAEEAVHDAFVSIWHSADRFRPEAGSALGWICTIVRRRAIDRLRASPWLHRELTLLPEDDYKSADTTPEERLTLEQCLAELSAHVRTAIRLAYLYGMTHSELSARLDMPLGTLKSQLRRGLASLRECLSR